MAAHHASDLAVATWCNLDFPWRGMGGELERHGTLASGADRCDFRFRVAAQLHYLPADVLKNHNGSTETT